jgi:hypothetical protein
MTYYTHTTANQITEKVKSLNFSFNDKNFQVFKLEDNAVESVLFQIKFYNKSIKLNELLMLGLAAYNPNITAEGNNTMITFLVEPTIGK